MARVAYLDEFRIPPDVSDEMTVKELRAFAKSHNLSLSGVQLKADIIESINCSLHKLRLHPVLDDMTVAQLREYARVHKINLHGATHKAAILALCHEKPQEDKKEVALPVRGKPGKKAIAS